MKIIGIVAEYNPFHLGHLYQIDKIKELYPDSTIIAIVSTYFTERGELSILTKWDKARIAINNGIDLVVELPCLYSTQSADIFANKAIDILNSLKIDTLVFGSESNDIELLKKLVNIQLNDTNYNKMVKEYLDSGINYPTAMSKALYDLTNYKIDKPNDLLAISYIKEIYKNNYNIEPIAIKRTNDYHAKDIKSNIVNASLIREFLKNGKDIKSYIPKGSIKYIKNISLNNAFNYLKYSIIINKEHLKEFLDVDEGIESRIINNINKATDWNNLIERIKTKRYTYNRINRMLIHILLSIKKKDNNTAIYLRIIGFNNKGKRYLNSIKKEINLPIINKYKPNINKTLDTEIKASQIYSLISNDSEIITKEYQNKPIIINK